VCRRLAKDFHIGDSIIHMQGPVTASHTDYLTCQRQHSLPENPTLSIAIFRKLIFSNVQIMFDFDELFIIIKLQ